MSDWMASLKPGDDVFVSRGYHSNLTSEKVKSNGKIHIVLEGGGKYRKRNGCSILGSSWNRWSIVEATTENRDRYLREKYCVSLGAVDWKELPLEVLKLVVELIKTARSDARETCGAASEVGVKQ